MRNCPKTGQLSRDVSASSANGKAAEQYSRRVAAFPLAELVLTSHESCSVFGQFLVFSHSKYIYFVFSRDEQMRMKAYKEKPMDTFDFKRIEEELQEGLKPGLIGLSGLTKQRGWSSPVFGNTTYIPKYETGFTFS